MIKRTLLLLSLACFYINASCQNDVNEILSRYKTYYLALSSTSADSINLWVNSLNKNNQWDDINYKNQDKSAWDLNRHLDRIRQIATNWADPKSSFYQQEKAWQTISNAIDHWLVFRYQNPNWWHNEIGVPQYWRDIIILTRSHLSKTQYTNSLAVLGQYQLKGTGANLVWSADLAIHYGALTADEKLIKKASALIADEIKITTGDGIQPDFSYHQHSARLQTYHYGSSFVKDNIRLAWQLQDTPWQFPTQKITILTNFILEGWQWMARGENTVPGTLDRSVSRKDYLKSADLKTFLPYLIKLAPTKSSQLGAILLAQNTNGTAIKGYRFYPYSDFTAYQQQGFSYFLKTISTRTAITEQINGENSKGNFLNFGDSYFIRKGTEYFNLMPMWDWNHLPGITNFIGAKSIDKQDFNGAVSNGNYGFSAMILKSTNEKNTLTTHKFWANYKNAMVCLISDLSLNADTGAIFTTLNQARLEGKVTLNAVGNVISEGSYQLNNVKWIFHAGFAYYPLGNNKINLFLGSRSGAWADINASGSKKINTEKLFMPIVDHPNHTNFAYAVVAIANPMEAQQLNQHFNWKILSNTKICQAIIFDATVLMATFKEKGTFILNKMKITVDQPCLIMIENGKILASSPFQKGGILNIKINEKNNQMNLPTDGSTVYKIR